MKLNFEDIARGFIVGSAELDRMRREVQTLVGGLVGLVHLAEIHHFLDSNGVKRCYHQVPDGTGEWEIRARVVRSIKRNAEIDIYYRRKTPNTLAEMPPIYATFLEMHLGNEDAQEVHRALPYLVQAMVATFPMLYERLKPFLNAAEATT